MTPMSHPRLAAAGGVLFPGSLAQSRSYASVSPACRHGCIPAVTENISRQHDMYTHPVSMRDDWLCSEETHRTGLDPTVVVAVTAPAPSPAIRAVSSHFLVRPHLVCVSPEASAGRNEGERHRSEGPAPVARANRNGRGDPPCTLDMYVL